MIKQRNVYQNKLKMKGQSLVEFALVLPLLLLLVIGAMDIGRMFYIKVALTNAAREGANYLAYHVSDEMDGDFSGTYEAIKAEAESLGVEVVTGGENSEADIIGACVTSSVCLPGNEVGVQISKPFDLLFGNLLATLGLTSGPLTLVSTIWMVVQ